VSFRVIVRDLEATLGDKERVRLPVDRVSIVEAETGEMDQKSPVSASDVRFYLSNTCPCYGQNGASLVSSLQSLSRHPFESV
jgi:hypothetical protein